MTDEQPVNGRADELFSAAMKRSAEKYHTDYDSGDSHSSLELFLESPAKYAAIRVNRTMQPEPSSSSARVGQALHALMFEYDKECRFAVLRRSQKTAVRELFYNTPELEKQKTQMPLNDLQTVFRMLAAIAGELDAWNLLVEQAGWNERIFTAHDNRTMLSLKCKPDRVLENGLVIDLKTVDGDVDPASWPKTLLKWGYHRQAAFYLDVLALAGQKADMFIFVAISKRQPHEIGIYLIGEESIKQGRRENRDLLERLAECRRTGVWKHEWQGKILTADVPRWAITD